MTPLTKTDFINAQAPDNPAIIDTARINPDTGTQFHVLRHADSTSTSVDWGTCARGWSLIGERTSAVAPEVATRRRVRLST